jgi:hypothetical protein
MTLLLIGYLVVGLSTLVWVARNDHMRDDPSGTLLEWIAQAMYVIAACLLIMLFWPLWILFAALDSVKLR